MHQLFREGCAVLRKRPVPGAGREADVLAELEQAYAALVLEVGGSAIPFDRRTALTAAEFVWQACWFLVSHEEPDEEVRRRLHWPGLPSSPAQHLSADLVLRYLPGVHRRARALNAADCLAGLAADLLRRWPLSGVLSEVTEAPLADLTFGGHDGLLLMYAERLADHEKPAWLPPEGRGREFVELVFRERGRPWPAL